MLDSAVQKRLQQYKKQNLWRTRLERKVNSTLINFCSNDYLSLTQHPSLKKAWCKGIDKYGTGSGASAMVSGYCTPQRLLEEKMADFLQCERALFFNSGYLANLGVLSTLLDRHSQVFSDKLCHASLLDGIRLAQAKHHRYQHLNFGHLKTLLQRFTGPAFIVTESVFSMEGDLCPLDQLQVTASQYQAALIVDDAHGIGVLGQSGRGICEHFSISPEKLSCLIVPLGKAFAGAGAMVAGKHEMIEALLQLARTYRYTTALPPAAACAALEALKIIQKEEERREKLTRLIHYFNQQATERQLPLVSTDPTPIKSIKIKDCGHTLAIQQALLKYGFWVACIRPPSVPRGQARLRISLNYQHQFADIDRLLHLLSQILARDSHD